MELNFQKSLDLVLDSEKGFVNNPNDPGGITNLGVTKASWESWKMRAVNIDEMRALTKEDVIPFYRKKYWDAMKCDDLPLGMDYAAFDFAVNAGVGRAAKTLQTALGVAADGVIGPATMKVAQAFDPDEFLERFSKAKESYYKTLNTFPIFGKGWLKRVDTVQNSAESMIG